MKQIFCPLLLAAAAMHAGAAVADSAPNGFTLKVTVDIKAAPGIVYDKVVNNIGGWWDPAHTFSGNSANLSIEEKALGCFCEKVKGGMSRNMQVIYFVPDETLVMTGAPGLLRDMAATATMSIGFAAAEGGTRVSVIYAVGGYSPSGLDKLAGMVDGVLLAQFTRLKNFIEKGKP
jgi:hypothetical protein